MFQFKQTAQRKKALIIYEILKKGHTNLTQKFIKKFNTILRELKVH